jgi:catechol 2,3-dioxygenase-like lactoylglutathione lyase family enzyme
MLSDYPLGARLQISDLERARAFYVEVLGFRPRAEAPGHAISFDSGDGAPFAIYVVPELAAPQATWSVDDVDAEVEELQARGVVFEEYDTPEFKSVNGVVQGGRGHFAFFKDPDGNLLGIFGR